MSKTSDDSLLATGDRGRQLAGLILISVVVVAPWTHDAEAGAPWAHDVAPPPP